MMTRIPTGHWGIPTGASPGYKTAYLICRKLLRHLTGNPRLRAPNANDRTWPDREQYLSSHPGYQKVIKDAVNSELLEDALPFFDWQVIRDRTQVWLSSPSGGAALLVSLLSLHRFLMLSR